MTATYVWEVFIPGQDLPDEVETDDVRGTGETIQVGRRRWIIENIEVSEGEEPGAGRIYVALASEGGCLAALPAAVGHRGWTLESVAS